MNKKIEGLKKLKLAVFDSDGVLVKKGTTISEIEKDGQEIITITQNIIPKETIDGLLRLKEKGIMVCISSGRSMLYLQTAYRDIMGDGTILMAEDGNFLLHGSKLKQAKKYSNDYFSKFANIVKHTKLLYPNGGFEQKQFMLTFHPRPIVEDKRIYDIVKKVDNNHELKIMWVGDECFNIGHKEVSKGKTLRKLIKSLGLKKENVLAIGDSYNDIPLLNEAGIKVSANIDKIQAPYWTTGNKLPSHDLMDYILKND